MSKTKRNHFVPKAYLRNFSVGEENIICVFDKEKETRFKTSIPNVGVRKLFYTQSIEDGLSNLEGEFTTAITSLQKSGIGGISEDDKHTIATFISAQMLRTPRYRQEITERSNGFAERLERACEGGDTPEHIAEWIEDAGSDSTGERLQLQMLEESGYKKFVPHLFELKWSLLTTTNPLFCTTDHPVALNNTLYSGLGTLGLKSRGIKIYFPISSTQLLLIADPCYQIPNSLQAEPEVVEETNLVLAAWANRFVYHSIDEFSFVKSLP